MGKLTVRDLLGRLPVTAAEFAVVAPASPLRDMVHALLKAHGRRNVYVVGSSGELLGSIALDTLKDVVLRSYLEGRVGNSPAVTEYLAGVFTSERADDLMVTRVVSCREHEELAAVISRMIDCQVKELPVLDEAGRVIAVLDVLHLMELWLLRGREVL